MVLTGTILKEGDQTLADFSARNEDVRRRGFLVGGVDRLPYPFSDRLVEPVPGKIKGAVLR